MSNNSFDHVNYLWDDATASTLEPVERLVHRSNILGSDARITNRCGERGRSCNFEGVKSGC